MCELLGVTTGRKVRINKLLETFFSHSAEHRNGWGLALLDRDPVYLRREPIKASDSLYLKKELEHDIETTKCIAHIREATIGEMKEENTHPFSRIDDTGRLWVLAHNGTIFDSDLLSPCQYVQEGTTDSERILICIVGNINRLCREKGREAADEERIRIVEEAVHGIVPGNKVNILLNDGDLLYVHKNEAGTLYEKEMGDGMVFSTKPLDSDDWTEFPDNRLMVYKDGTLVYEGKKHDWTYVHDDERMKMLFLEYSGL